MKLEDKTDVELREIAKKDYGLKLPAITKRPKLLSEIEKAEFKRKMRMEAAARAELALEAGKKLGIDTKKKRTPSPETVAIEASKKKYYLFTNNEEEGVKVALRKGEKYRFELYDGKVHILPDWLVRNLRKTATAPIYAIRKNRVTGLDESQHVGNRPRFAFEELDDAPKDAEFGVVIDREVENKYLKPVEELQPV